MKKIILSIFTIGLFTIKTNAQGNDGFESILFAAKGDAGKMVNAYVSPAMKGLIFGMNGGWYHTAKVHKKLGFDLTIGANLSFIPEKDEVFNIANLGLTTVSSTSKTAATVAGSETIEAPMTVNTTIKGEKVSANFNMPGGIKEDLPVNAVPAPAIQIGLGLPYKLEVMARFVPKVGSEDVKGGLFGIGVKKEITSWFGPLDKLPLHVSLLGAYTNMNVDYTIIDDSTTDNIVVRNGNAEFNLNSYTVQAIASLNFPIINIYGGVGYGGGNSKIAVNGEYELTYNANGGGTVTSDPLVNPINEKFSAGSFRTTLGARISLGFFKIFGDYTFQEYNTANVGIALSFR